MESLSRNTLQQIVASSSSGIVLVEAHDPALRIAYVNPAYEEMSGYTAAELTGASWKSFFADDPAFGALEELRRSIGRSECCDVQAPFFRKDGSRWTSRLNIRPLTDNRGDTRYFLCQHETAEPETASTVEVETRLLKRALSQARKKLVSFDRTDTATGLLAFEHFAAQLRRDLSIASRQGHPITIMLFEVVELDVYRQTFGSNAADSCLRMIGAQIAGTFRRVGDLCARYDQSTIAVAVQGLEISQAGLLAKRVNDKIRSLGLHNPKAKSGRYITVRSSVTAAELEHDDVDTLIDRAHVNLGFEMPDAKRQAAG